MPVVRNPQFYFKEGFCWSDIGGNFIKCRLKGNTIHDVKSMTLMTEYEGISNNLIVTYLSSKLLSAYQYAFVNNTVSIQINDIRSLPIIIPDKNTYQELNNLFNKAFEAKKLFFRGEISSDICDVITTDLQNELDKQIGILYSI